MSGSSMTAKGVLAFAVGAALFPAACSGDSTTSGDSNAGKGGSNSEAGAPSGGSAGSSGGAAGSASGGKGGAGGSAGTGKGGAAGSATSGAAGSPTSGGASGEGGAADAAGAPASGGSAGDTSSGGAAGAGAMRGYHPPSDQIDACTSLCEREAEANCPNEGTVQECFDGCRVGIQFEPCAAGWDAMFACVETADTVTCNAEGEATVADCVTQYAEVIDCVFNDNLDQTYEARCDAYCAALEPAACENAGAASECQSTCVILGSAFPVCSDVYTEFLECGTAADITCDDAGEPTAEDCASEYVLFLSCLVSEYDWQL